MYMSQYESNKHACNSLDTNDIHNSVICININMSTL